MVLGLSELPVIKKPFHVPSLEEIANVLNGGLKKHFAEIHVSVVECPDLRKPPFGLVSQGLGGNPRLIEVGAANYLLPLVNREKTYELKDIAKISEINPAFIIGAGAGPFKFQKTNCEGIININIDNGVANQQSRIGKINPVDKSRIEEILPQNVTDFALLANLFATEGKPGKVLKVHAAKRIGSLDYIASIRTILTDFYEQKKVVVGMGGTFLMKEGKAKLHIMPDFSASPINNWDELNQWLQFFNMSAPLIGVGTFTTSEYDIDLRVQHFHMFSNHGDAGHYHIDTTPEEVEYLGYFNTGDFIYRVDKPENSIPFGKD